MTCDKIFEEEVNLDNHVNRLHVFKCELCGIHKLEKSELMDHMHRNHTATSEICNAVFKDFLDLQSHKKECSEYMFRCELCGVRFNKENELEDHI